LQIACEFVARTQANTLEKFYPGEPGFEQEDAENCGDFEKIGISTGGRRESGEQNIISNRCSGDHGRETREASWSAAAIPSAGATPLLEGTGRLKSNLTEPGQQRPQAVSPPPQTQARTVGGT
jgi:hypothetical protein